MNLKKYRLLSFLLLIFLFVLAGCSNKTATKSNDSKIKIVTTTDFYAEVAKAVVGDKGTVTSIINNPAIDPHDYEPTTNVAKQVSNADITVANGLGYDSWMNKLNQNDNSTFIKIGENVMNKKVGDNPHIWYKPQTMPKYAKYLAKELAKKDPDDKTYFEDNAQKYISSLQPVQNELTKLRQKSQNSKNKNVYVSEPVFDYSLKSIGFKVANKSFEKAIENGTDPTPANIKQMNQGIKNKKIAFLVFNTQTDSKIINNFVKKAQANDIPVLKVTETLPKGKTYKQWMLSQYKDLNKILQSEK
ncbi:ABC-type metal ion transport system, periplasmic component surface adhesin [Companilactobacillus paralimentarius DSM 13238 = JCM 10415]|jgi:ABC-type metal ion transport system, periplasmic component/surface adhesin|uniref:ABC-type metal ion transport system, periplasmic component surface adhesin n=1 Tax=Companilactobacillus paralimentarius DSM 13238 = JCM 10415 TaxID=1122151 RepID=A0A0R1PGH9_9LACO|nr:metal ABC transporter solute-binding protein [Companilactobacillus paralimentarius]KAE9563358.1 metal ABC transporter substrate-binding protein [Companilactobacillus paralimentarius]KRL31342.1 ABC-type metal ion transport system, periplasmic component surface adhesin [Companilactobacillus paralimentarius DSM 13238 = JCM 10415]MDR4932490.1 metal ABC transporter solute-binding protein [Companilactobacillus paralimentarius]QFR69098.1 metal ABC transporter substrate-binding protein [Companilacto